MHIGLSLSDYWNMNPKQFEKYVKAYNRRIEEELQIADVLNHALGKYISFAFHSPDKYPEKPFSSKKETKKDMSDKDMERAAMINTLALGGRVNGIYN